MWSPYLGSCPSEQLGVALEGGDGAAKVALLVPGLPGVAQEGAGLEDGVGDRPGVTQEGVELEDGVGDCSGVAQEDVELEDGVGDRSGVAQEGVGLVDWEGDRPELLCLQIKTLL